MKSEDHLKAVVKPIQSSLRPFAAFAVDPVLFDASALE
jgi:hypothetical protein